MLQKLQKKVLGESVAEKAKTNGGLPARANLRRKLPPKEVHTVAELVKAVQAQTPPVALLHAGFCGIGASESHTLWQMPFESVFLAIVYVYAMQKQERGYAQGLNKLPKVAQTRMRHGIGWKRPKLSEIGLRAAEAAPESSGGERG